MSLVTIIQDLSVTHGSHLNSDIWLPVCLSIVHVPLHFSCIFLVSSLSVGLRCKKRPRFSHLATVQRSHHRYSSCCSTRRKQLHRYRAAIQKDFPCKRYSLNNDTARIFRASKWNASNTPEIAPNKFEWRRATALFDVIGFTVSQSSQLINLAIRWGGDEPGRTSLSPSRHHRLGIWTDFCPGCRECFRYMLIIIWRDRPDESTYRLINKPEPLARKPQPLRWMALSPCSSVSMYLLRYKHKTLRFPDE